MGLTWLRTSLTKGFLRSKAPISDRGMSRASSRSSSRRLPLARNGRIRRSGGFSPKTLLDFSASQSNKLFILLHHSLLFHDRERRTLECQSKECEGEITFDHHRLVFLLQLLTFGHLLKFLHISFLNLPFPESGMNGTKEQQETLNMVTADIG